MIIEALMNVIYSVISILTTPINIPDLPDEALNYINQLFDYLEVGASILANYTPFGYLMILFGLILAIDIAIKIYHLVMWILRKIPMISMS